MINQNSLAKNFSLSFSLAAIVGFAFAFSAGCSIEAAHHDDVATMTEGVANADKLVAKTYYTDADYSAKDCNLEMFVYRDDTKAVAGSFKPVMVLHAGGWATRPPQDPPVVLGLYGTSAADLEAGQIDLSSRTSITKGLTDRGFVVFVPYYRLNGHLQPGVVPAACSGASAEDILRDVNAAFNWVDKHKSEYSARESKIDLVGFSAGAHLALWLTIAPYDGGEPQFKSRSRVRRALVHAAPSDFGNLTDSVYMTNAAADLDTYIGEGFNAPASQCTDYINGFVNAASPNLASNVIIAINSFHSLLDYTGGPIPLSELAPMLMIHGAKDTCIPAMQSVDLCVALGGYHSALDVPKLGPEGCGTGPCSQEARSYTGVCGETGKFIIDLHFSVTHDILGCTGAQGAECTPDLDEAVEKATTIAANRALNWLQVQ